MDIITSAYVGNNDDLIKEVCKLYTKPGDIIADVTFGKGVFWKKVDTSQFDFRPTDILAGIDFRNLPYENDSIDVVVLDPPYMRRSSAKLTIDLYHNNERKEIGKDLITLYSEGMTEAYRVLRVDGLLWVKCQDQVESGENKFDHISIYNEGMANWFNPVDLFILVRKNKPIMRHTYQIHARKNHSYLWIFRKV